MQKGQYNTGHTLALSDIGDDEKSTDINKLEPIITWKDFQKTMPWEIVVLVGGGYALAAGCKVLTQIIFFILLSKNSINLLFYSFACSPIWIPDVDTYKFVHNIVGSYSLHSVYLFLAVY